MTAGDVLFVVIALLVALQVFLTLTARIAAWAQRASREEPSSRAGQLPVLKRRDPPPTRPSFALPPRPSPVRVEARGRRPRAARLTPAEARRAIRWITILEPCGGRPP
jgi:hypothetical protein